MVGHLARFAAKVERKTELAPRRGIVELDHMLAHAERAVREVAAFRPGIVGMRGELDVPVIHRRREQRRTRFPLVALPAIRRAPAAHDVLARKRDHQLDLLVAELRKIAFGAGDARGLLAGRARERDLAPAVLLLPDDLALLAPARPADRLVEEGELLGGGGRNRLRGGGRGPGGERKHRGRRGKPRKAAEVGNGTRGVCGWVHGHSPGRPGGAVKRPNLRRQFTV